MVFLIGISITNEKDMTSSRYVKTGQELMALRESGKRLAEVMALMADSVRVGISTGELDRLAEERMRSLGGDPVFKGYRSGPRPFPASICSSINQEVVHGIPRKDRTVVEGDLLKIDMGLRYRGMVSDMARTFPVGSTDKEAARLVDVTRESLDRGISVLRPGTRLHEYARAVQDFVEAAGFSVVRDLVGHGVGRELHEPPFIPNYVDRVSENFVFTEGMSVALEPMVNAGTWKVEPAADGWTYVSVDGSLSAHFEDTVIITHNGAEIVTRI